MILVCCIIIPISILVTVGFRLFIFLKDGYNPSLTIDTFFPKSSSEWTWKGVELIYDFIVNIPYKIFALVFWFLFIILWSQIQGHINGFEAKHM